MALLLIYPGHKIERSLLDTLKMRHTHHFLTHIRYHDTPKAKNTTRAKFGALHLILSVLALLGALSARMVLLYLFASRMVA